eukprot:GILJ01007510.1.p1 GENE.GILJ01007510.1~~GILJ01007510.1.p1  ORF type:complete len:672 (+),score=107.52 GILJ01007510.1:43-2058(+)
MEKYKVGEALGRGAQAVVHGAVRKADGRPCVMKQLTLPLSEFSAKERRETETEVRILRLIQHPNVCAYLDSFEENGYFNIIMELADGGTLNKKLNDREGVFMPEDEILDLAAQIALGLKFIHDAEIIHRDIKPHNIFLTKEGVVKLGDFGVSKVLSTNTNLASTLVGTPLYLAPELWEGKPYDQKSDVWSFGVTLYEMVALKRPFESTNMPALMLKIMRARFEPLPTSFSEELREFVKFVLAPKAELRPSIQDILVHPLMAPKADFWEEEAKRRTEEVLARCVPVMKKVTTFTWTWGRNGSIARIVESLNPFQVVQVGCGYEHFAVLTSDSKVYTWGDNNCGQLGHDPTREYRRPERVALIQDHKITQLACGYEHTAVVTDANEVFVWGEMEVGSESTGTDGVVQRSETGEENEEEEEEEQFDTVDMQCKPRMLPLLDGVVVRSISCGKMFMLLLGDDGRVWGMGANSHGQLGLPETEYRCVPEYVSSIKGVVKQISCGLEHSLVLTDAEKVYAFGNNCNGQLAADAETEYSSTPKLIRELKGRIIQVSAGYNHNAAISDTGAIFTWGQGDNGQLGHGNLDDQVVPKRIDSFAKKNVRIARVSCGHTHTLAVDEEGKLWTWGVIIEDRPPDKDNKIPRVIETLVGRNIQQLSTGSWSSIAVTEAVEEDEDG